IPAASIAPIMLVEQAITVEKAGVVGSMPAFISTSRAMLLHIRLGTTAPHTAKSGLPFSRSTMCRATGTDSSIASSAFSAPSTLAKGVRTPDASQTSTGRGMEALGRLFERGRDVARGDAAQVAHLGRVERSRAMHGAAVVPDHQVALAPFVGVHELRP